MPSCSQRPLHLLPKQPLLQECLMREELVMQPWMRQSLLRPHPILLDPKSETRHQ